MRWVDLSRDQQRDMLETFMTPQVITNLEQVLAVGDPASRAEFRIIDFDRVTFEATDGTVRTPVLQRSLIHCRLLPMHPPLYVAAYELTLTDFGAGMLKTLRETTRG